MQAGAILRVKTGAERDSALFVIGSTSIYLNLMSKKKTIKV